jgi:hypothetical protein
MMLDFNSFLPVFKDLSEGKKMIKRNVPVLCSPQEA